MSNPLGGLVLPRDQEARTRVTAIAVVLSLVAGLVGLAFVAAAPAHAATTNVSIKNFSFNPQDVTISVGDTVHWSNDETDGTVHSVTADDGSFTQDLNPGDTFSHTFGQAGTFGVHCRFHTYITGTITVNSGGSSSSTTSTTAAPSTTSTTAPSTTSTTTPSSTTSTTVPSSTTSTTAPDTTSTTTPDATTSTTAPDSTTSTTAPPSSSPSTTSTTAPQDDSILGGSVIPPVDGALTGVFDALHSALVSVDDALAGGS